MRSRPALGRFAGAVLAFLWSGAAVAQDLEAYAEEFPPYNFLRDGTPAGISTDLLDRACKEAGLQCKIHITPWARAYRYAQTQKNCLVFSTTRTTERDSHFLWVGPILPRATSLYVLASTSFSSERLAGRDGFVIGTVYNDVSIHELHDLGVPDSAMQSSPTFDDSLRKLMAGRVSAVVNTDVGMRWFLRTHGYEYGAVKAAMTLPGTGDYYYALNIDSDPVLAKKLQDGLGAALRANALAEILDAYLGLSGTGRLVPAH